MPSSNRTGRIAIFAVGVCLLAGADWMQFRGTDNTSVSTEEGLPKDFDAATGRNVAWKIDLPGRGPSGPIVVAGRVIVTSATGPTQDRLHVLCYDAASGKLLWHRQLWATGPTSVADFSGVAAPTPASDGRLIFALFSSNDLACFDLDGNLQWVRGLSFESPTTRNNVGMASSPLVVGSTVVVQLENQGESFATGLDTATGETRWRIEREHDAIWCSPTVLRGKQPDDDLVLLQGRKQLSAHDPRTGKKLWAHDGKIETISSVTTCGDTIYLPAVGLWALRSESRGRRVTPLWYNDRLRPANSSPVAFGDYVYFIKPAGILVCCEARDGKVAWQLRLKGPVWATPVLADKHLYVVNHDGLVQVVALEPQGKLVGTSRLGEPVLASPAVADGAIYLRGDSHLWKLAMPRK